MTQEFISIFYRNCVVVFMVFCCVISVGLLLQASRLAEEADKFGKLSSHYPMWTSIDYRDPRCPEELGKRYLSLRWKLLLSEAAFLCAPWLFGYAGEILGLLG